MTQQNRGERIRKKKQNKNQQQGGNQKRGPDANKNDRVE
jgi:hypothetical protein